MPLIYKALLAPTAVLDATGNAQPDAVFVVRPLAGGNGVPVYASDDGNGGALNYAAIKSDERGNVSGFYVDQPGLYALDFGNGVTVPTVAVRDDRDIPDDLATATSRAFLTMTPTYEFVEDYGGGQYRKHIAMYGGDFTSELTLEQVGQDPLPSHEWTSGATPALPLFAPGHYIIHASMRCLFNTVTNPRPLAMNWTTTVSGNGGLFLMSEAFDVAPVGSEKALAYGLNQYTHGAAWQKSITFDAWEGWFLSPSMNYFSDANIRDYNEVASFPRLRYVITRLE